MQTAATAWVLNESTYYGLELPLGPAPVCGLLKPLLCKEGRLVVPLAVSSAFCFFAGANSVHWGCHLCPPRTWRRAGARRGSPAARRTWCRREQSRREAYEASGPRRFGIWPLVLGSLCWAASASYASCRSDSIYICTHFGGLLSICSKSYKTFHALSPKRYQKNLRDFFYCF